MSLIGTLEQFSLSLLLQRIERHEKTGLLVLKQGMQWIEFYLRAGRLLCVGPVRTNASLGERLLQDGIITSSAWHESLLLLRDDELSESRIARTLMEVGFTTREDLRAWTIKNTINVLQVILSWSTGDVYFEEGRLPPSDRLLVSMSVSSLLASMTPVASQVPRIAAPVKPTLPPGPISQAPTVMHPVAKTPSPDVARVPTLMSSSQFIDDSSFAAPSLSTSFTSFPAQSPERSPIVSPNFSGLEPSAPPADVAPFAASSLLSADATDFASPFVQFDDNPSFDAFGSVAVTPAPDEPSFASLFADESDEGQSSSGLILPELIEHPIPPQRIDTSFMQPEMVLWPADLKAYRAENPRLQITPDQWIILTRVDGQMPLSIICQDLGLSPEFVCQTAGELIALGLIHISLPSENPLQEASPVSRELSASGMGNGYVEPGAASAPVSPWSASLPSPATPNSVGSPSFPFETESQWGNGGNGAMFVPGQGWVTAPQSPYVPDDPFSPPDGSYTPMSIGY